MATTRDRYEIQVDTAGAKDSLNGLKSAVGALIAAFSVRELAQFSDSIANVRNRLNQVSTSVENTTAQFKALAGISINARAPLEQTADLYFRIARSAEALGISQQQAAKTTELIAKAITSSGISAQEAAGPLLQLGQALQSGTLQGDELRSILEGLPPVARALADSLGVPVGALRKLGSEGKLSSRQVVDAIMEAAEAIEEDFAKTVPTIGQAFTNLQTVLALAQDNFEQNTQAGQTFALSIEYIAFQVYKLSQGIDQIIGPIKTFVKVIAGILAFTVVGKILRGIVGVVSGAVAIFGNFTRSISLAKDMVRNFGSVMSVTGGVVSDVYAVIKIMLTPLAKLVALLASAYAGIKAFFGVEEVIDNMSSLTDETSEARTELEEFKAMLRENQQALDDTATAGTGAAYALEQFNEKLQTSIDRYREINQETIQGLEETRDLIGLKSEEAEFQKTILDFTKEYNEQIAKLRKQKEELLKNEEDNADKIGIVNQRIQEITDEYNNQLPVVQELANEIRQKTIETEKAAEAAKEMEKSLEKARDAAQDASDFMKKLNQNTENARFELESMNMTPLQKQLAEIERDLRTKLSKEIDKLQKLKTPDNVAEINAQISAITNATNAAIEEQKRIAEQVYEQQRSFEYGWRKAFESYQDDATNAAKKAEEIFKKTTQGIEDTIVNFVKTGKFEFKSLVADILETLLRSQIQQTIAQIFQATNLSSGFASLSNPFAGFFANGGMIPAGQFGVVGERGPELVTGPAQVTPLTGGGNVTYNINAVDASSFKQLVARDPEFIHAVALKGGRSIPGGR